MSQKGKDYRYQPANKITCPVDKKQSLAYTNSGESKVNFVNDKNKHSQSASVLKLEDHISNNGPSGITQELLGLKKKDDSIDIKTKGVADEEISGGLESNDSQQTWPGKLGPLDGQDFSQMTIFTMGGKQDAAICKLFSKLRHLLCQSLDTVAARDTLPSSLRFRSCSLVYSESADKDSANLKDVYMEPSHKEGLFNSGIVKKLGGKHDLKHRSETLKPEEEGLKNHTDGTGHTISAVKHLYKNWSDDHRSKEIGTEINVLFEEDSYLSLNQELVDMEDEGEETLLVQYYKGRHIVMLASKKPGEPAKIVELSCLEFDTKVSPQSEDIHDPEPPLSSEHIIDHNPLHLSTPDVSSDRGFPYSASLKAKTDRDDDFRDFDQNTSNAIIRKKGDSNCQKKDRGCEEKRHPLRVSPEEKLCAALLDFSYYDVITQPRPQTDVVCDEGSQQLCEDESEKSSNSKERAARDYSRDEDVKELDDSMSSSFSVDNQLCAAVQQMHGYQHEDYLDQTHEFLSCPDGGAAKLQTNSCKQTEVNSSDAARNGDHMYSGDETRTLERVDEYSSVYERHLDAGGLPRQESKSQESSQCSASASRGMAFTASTTSNSVQCSHLNEFYDSDGSFSATEGFMQNSEVPEQTFSSSFERSAMEITHSGVTFIALHSPVQVSSFRSGVTIPTHFDHGHESYEDNPSSVPFEENEIDIYEISPVESSLHGSESGLGACGGHASVVAQEQGCFFRTGIQVEDDTELHVTQESVYLFRRQQDIGSHGQSECPEHHHFFTAQETPFAQNMNQSDSSSHANSTPLHAQPVIVHAASAIPPWATPTALIDLRQAANRDYVQLGRRRATYGDNWPDDSGIDAANMALAGFFNTGHGHNVRCFYCGLELGHLRAGDNIWDEHVRRNPNCHYLVAIMGRSFVNQTLARLQEKNNHNH